MEIGELCNEGWHVSSEGYKSLTQNGDLKNKKNIISNALNTDIKDFGEAFLSSELKQNKTGKIILQIQKIRNITAPKNKEESQAAPRMLKLTLTDGHTNCIAIEIASIPSLSRTNTPPGSKLLINNAKIFSSYILLQPNCCTLLGGNVPLLCEKWELLKSVTETVRTSVGVDGPPPWVNFGEKIISSTTNEPFKSLASKTDKETTNEFDVHRQDAIANASSGAIKKVFGGGVKNALPMNNKPTTNQRYNKKNAGNQGAPLESGNETNKGFRGKSDTKERSMDKPQRPAEKISLFDFLEDKLPANESTSFQYNDAKYTKDNNLHKQETHKPFVNNYYQQPAYQKQQFKTPQKHFASNNFNPRNSNSSSFNRNNPNSSNFNQSNRQSADVSSKKDFVETVTKDFEKVSLNTQFASRSLRQHLNLASNKNNESKFGGNTNSNTSWNWKVGDLCMAKYWEDSKYYNATIMNLTERTCVVKFNGYGNVEEVLKVDCIPISNSAQESHLGTNVKQRSFKEYYNRRPQYNNKTT